MVKMYLAIDTNRHIEHAIQNKYKFAPAKSDRVFHAMVEKLLRDGYFKNSFYNLYNPVNPTYKMLVLHPDIPHTFVTRIQKYELYTRWKWER